MCPLYKYGLCIFIFNYRTILLGGRNRAQLMVVGESEGVGGVQVVEQIQVVV